MSERYIGLMSGTSVDGIDAVIVDFNNKNPEIVATFYEPYEKGLRARILALCHGSENEIKQMGEIDNLLAKAFANAVSKLLAQVKMTPDAIKAIGSHGQTIRHYPNQPFPFTLQIGDPNTLAAATGITTVADFRRKDMAFGGQGAPLVPAFHQHVFASDATNRAIVNIGGIANVTLLPKQTNQAIIGFDTGPGNVLLDAWIFANQQQNYDQHGLWARKGTVIPQLLSAFLADDYFHLAPPKSTGREYFHLDWLHKHLQATAPNAKDMDVQATLTELTAASIAQVVKGEFREGEIFVCGGGAHNDYLLERLAALAAPTFTVQTTKAIGMDPDWIEATAFAWLAKQRLDGKPSNLPSVTGASKSVILGGIYLPN